jgi:hypothetical protein
LDDKLPSDKRQHFAHLRFGHSLNDIDGDLCCSGFVKDNFGEKELLMNTLQIPEERFDIGVLPRSASRPAFDCMGAIPRSVAC